MTQPQIRITACSLALVAIVVSYLWVDQPVAFLVHRDITTKTLFVELTYIPEPLPLLGPIVFFALGLWALVAKPTSKLYAALVTCSISLIVAEAAKNQLKYDFGRTWPETWVNNNPSLIGNGAYGFNFSHGGIRAGPG